METRTLRLFLFTYQDREEIQRRPIYAITSELAIESAIEWLIEHENCTYVSITAAPKEGYIIDGTHYPATKEKPHTTGKLFLYVIEYFQNRHTVKGIPVRDVEQVPIYAANIEVATSVMNILYAGNGKGHLHKSLDQNMEGITIKGTYYPPTKDIGNG